MVPVKTTPPCQTAARGRGWDGGGLACLAALCLLAAVSPVGAEAPDSAAKDEGSPKTRASRDISDLDIEQMLRLGDLDVSVATKTKVPRRDVPGAVSILRGEELRDLGVRSLLEALQLLPGVDVVRDNLGRPQVTLRGAPSGGTLGASENLLVLLDGHRLNEELLGGAGTIFFDLPVDHVRQVELLRGPASALYGSGAVGGVVNIVMEDVQSFQGTELRATAGSHWTQDYVARSAGRVHHLGVSGYVRFVDTHGADSPIALDGQSSRDAERFGQGQEPISRAPGNADDAQRAIETQYRLTYREFSLGVFSRRETSGVRVGYADALGRQNAQDHFQFAMDGTWTRDLAAGGTLRLRGSFVQSDLARLYEVFPAGYEVEVDPFTKVSFGLPQGVGGVLLQLNLNSRRYGMDAAYDRDLGFSHHVSGGLSLEADDTFDLSARANLDYRSLQPLASEADGGLPALPGSVAETRRSVTGLYAQDIWSLASHHTLTSGLRLDHVWGVGATLSPRLTLTGRILPLETHLPRPIAGEVAYRLGYARGFRTPSINEQYFYLPGYSANRGLGYAKSDVWEGGLSLHRQRASLDTTLSYGLHRGVIGILEPFSATDPQTPVNAAGARVWAFEVEARGDLFLDDMVFAAYTFQHAIDRTTDEPVPAVPRHLLSVGSSIRFASRFTLAPTLVVRASRPRTLGDARDAIPASAVLSVSLRAIRLWRTLEATLRLQDLFDSAPVDPAEPWGVPGDYPSAGRAVLLGASYRF